IQIAVVAVATEAIWIGVRFRKQPIPETKPRLDKILIFNELGESCALFHKRYKAPGFARKCPNKYCSMAHMDTIVEHIDKAVYSIDISIYTFSSLTISEAFRRALLRGVTLRIISDNEMVSSAGSQVKVLAGLGVPVLAIETTYMMHNKFCIIDGLERVEEIRRQKNIKLKHTPCSIVITGSINWTRQAFNLNWENIFITDDEFVTAQYQMEFSRMWDFFGDPAKVPIYQH
ncbi:hypothetical protein KR067_006279, partial [Drosophila pandora]